MSGPKQEQTGCHIGATVQTNGEQNIWRRQADKPRTACSSGQQSKIRRVWEQENFDPLYSKCGIALCTRDLYSKDGLIVLMSYSQPWDFYLSMQGGRNSLKRRKRNQ